MIDLHCHILPRLDDGPERAAESAEMLRLAASDGITDIVATPHFFDGLHNVCPDRRDAYLEKFNSFLHKYGLKLRLHPGAEVRLVPGLSQLLDAPRRLTLNGSRYLLLELPLMMPPFLEKELYELQLKGISPILAHPERHAHIQHNPDVLLPLVSSGLLTQVTAQSLLGDFGEKCRICVETLVRNRTAHIVATDAHSARSRPPLLAAARLRLEQIVGSVEATAMVEIRPKAILQDQVMHVPSPLPATLRTMPDLIERLANLL